jgi:hypothetical protein
VDEAGCGWGLDSGDVAGVEQLIRSAMCARDELHRKGTAARDSFERLYSLDICARRFESELLNLSFAAGPEIVPAGRASR